MENSTNKKPTRTLKIKVPHMQKEKTENGKLKYFCKICDKQISRTQQYYHLYCNNSQNKPYSCQKCPKSFSSLSHLKYHAEEHELQEFTCISCSKTFKKLSTLKKHEKIHEEKKFFCKVCEQSYREKSTLLGHVARHKNIYLYSCELCDKNFSLKSSLNQHKASHLENKKHKCLQCGQIFLRSYSLKLHILRHSKQTNYSCTMCFKSFNNINALSRHKNIHKESTKYKCILCDISSVRKDNMIRHIRNMHAAEEFSDCIEIIKRVCTDLSVNLDDSPKTVVNSSVIKSIGNVQPMIVPLPAEQITGEGINNDSFVRNKKKKKYDPLEIYRQILNNDPNTDEEQEEEEERTKILPNSFSEKNVEQATSTLLANSTSGLLNFSERHWRKNLNLRVKEN